MPTTVISTAITVPVSAGSTNNSNFVVTGTGSISVGSAVALGSTAASGFSATVHGTVESYWQSTSFVATIYSTTPDSRITIGATGRVYGERETIGSGSGVVWTAGAGSVVTNHGNIISGTIEGVRLAHSAGSLTNTGLISAYSSALIATGPGTQVDNSGTMIATGSGGATISLGGGGEIVNSGLISGNGGAMAVSSTGFTQLNNSGTITSTSTAISCDDPGGSEVLNTGTIQTSDVAAFIGGMDADVVINRGTILGNVQLGNGANIFDNRGGTFSGVVEGGTDSDFYYFDVQTFGIFDNGGIDTALTTQSFSLTEAPFVEDLTLLDEAANGAGNGLENVITGNLMDNRIQGVGGDDTLHGMGGDDRLMGNSGNDTIYGGDDNDTIRGGVLNDILHGDEGDDIIWGDANFDRLYGEDGEDILIGGAGRDVLNGGADADTFRFDRVSDSGPGTTLRDQIIGFEADLDLIHLSLIDANTTLSGNQAFSWIGTAVFSNVAGQLRTVAGVNSLLQGDVNGDGVVDFELQLNATATVNVNDIVL